MASYSDWDQDYDNDYNSPESEDNDTDDDDISAPTETLSEVAANAFIVLAGMGIKSVGEAIHEHAKVEAEKERIKHERIQRRKDMTSEFLFRNRRIIFGLVMVTTLVLFVLYQVTEYRKLIPVGYSSDSLKGQHYEDVVPLLTDAGFTEISLEELYDLSLKDETQAGLVSQISISSNCTFTENDRFPYDAKVIVSFHSIRLISPPSSHKELRKLDYASALSQLKAAGFVNIKSEPIYDVVLGWLKKDGEIKTISIAGTTEFSNADLFRPDVEVIISYHTLQKNADSGT